jgi:hypothetical protein
MSARKIKVVTIEADNRDKGKRFQITEMFAWDWVRWTSRATLAVSRSGGNVPAGILQQGMAGIVSFGLQALTACEWSDAEPLMEELFACVKTMPDPERDAVVLKLRGEDIAESSTIYKLFEEVASLNLGFSLAEAGPKFLQALTALILQPDLSNLSTSQQSSPPSSSATT